MDDEQRAGGGTSSRREAGRAANGAGQGGARGRILGKPAQYDGTNDNVLKHFVINNQYLVHLFEVEDQPPLKNIKKVKKQNEAVDDKNNPNRV